MRTPTTPELESIARRHGLKLIVMFGSQVSGHTHPESDLDVAILPTHPLSWDERNVLWGELCELFQTEVDLSLLDHAQPLLMAEVTRHGQVLYEGEQSAWASLSFTPGVCIGTRLPCGKRRADTSTAVWRKCVMLDKALIEQKLAFLIEHLDELAPLSIATLEEYKTDAIKRRRYTIIFPANICAVREIFNAKTL